MIVLRFSYYFVVDFLEMSSAKIAIVAHIAIEQIYNAGAKTLLVKYHKARHIVVVLRPNNSVPIAYPIPLMIYFSLQLSI